MLSRGGIVVLVLLALFEIAGALVSIVSYDTPVGTYGFITKKDNETFAAVGERGPAAQAGIRVGDRLRYATLPLRGRRFVVFEEEVPGGAPISFVVVRGRAARAVTLVSSSLRGIGQLETLAYATAGLALALVGIALVLVRPSRMTWAFAWIAPPLVMPWALGFWAQEHQTIAAAAVDVMMALLWATSSTAIMIFASRFPNDRPRGLTAFIDRASVPVGIVVAAIYLYAYLHVRFTLVPPLHVIQLVDYAIVVPGGAALVALIATYVTTPGGTRTRLLPVIASFVVLIAMAVLQQIGTELTTNAQLLLWFGVAFPASPALVAAAVAYGVVRHRVMDVSFIISRTLVYSLLTVLAVAVFACIEYVFGKLLEHQGVATLLNILAAIGLGLGLNSAHKHLDDAIDRLLFRRRHLAERRLATVIRMLPHATSAATIDAALVNEPADALGLDAAAVYRLDDGSYHRVDAIGWRSSGDDRVLSLDDPLVLRLRTDLEALDPQDLQWQRGDDRGTAQQLLYAVPVVSGRDVSGIALYGGHSTGEDLDPDERHMLREIARAAGAGYERIATAQLRRKLELAEKQNAELRGVERKLTELLGREPT